jgi:hypothetical protein
LGPLLVLVWELHVAALQSAHLWLLLLVVLPAALYCERLCRWEWVLLLMLLQQRLQGVAACLTLKMPP